MLRTLQPQDRGKVKGKVKDNKVDNNLPALVRNSFNNAAVSRDRAKVRAAVNSLVKGLKCVHVMGMYFAATLLRTLQIKFLLISIGRLE